jgi:hypothetical protein
VTTSALIRIKYGKTFQVLVKCVTEDKAKLDAFAYIVALNNVQKQSQKSSLSSSSLSSSEADSKSQRKQSRKSFFSVFFYHFLYVFGFSWSFNMAASFPVCVSNLRFLLFQN